MDHAHGWTALAVPYYALRRCKTCGVLGRNSSGKVKELRCQSCKTAPATEWRFGAPYCAAHVPKPGNLRTLEDLSESEIKKLEQLYGVPVRRPK